MPRNTKLIYERGFAVKSQKGDFNGVSSYIKLEQNKSKIKKCLLLELLIKTPQVSHVTERELIYHKVLRFQMFMKILFVHD